MSSSWGADPADDPNVINEPLPPLSENVDLTQSSEVIEIVAPGPLPGWLPNMLGTVLRAVFPNVRTSIHVSGNTCRIELSKG